MSLRARDIGNGKVISDFCHCKDPTRSTTSFPSLSVQKQEIGWKRKVGAQADAEDVVDTPEKRRATQAIGRFLFPFSDTRRWSGPCTLIPHILCFFQLYKFSLTLIFSLSLFLTYFSTFSYYLTYSSVSQTFSLLLDIFLPQALYPLYQSLPHLFPPFLRPHCLWHTQ